MDDDLLIGDKSFKSRLILGTGKFPSKDYLIKAIEASETEMVTIALRRVDLNNPHDNLLSAINIKKIVFLPNTSGAKNAEEAIRLARLARATGLTNWIKLEVTPDPKYLLPDGEETLKAAKVLVKEGFFVMPYINADPVLAKKLEDTGTVSVMPLASPIGSNQGIKTLDMISIIIENSSVPVIVDAGIGRPSDAAIAMEMGADAVLVNTAIATAADPVLMAASFKDVVQACRNAYISGIATSKKIASPSSSLDWISQL